MSHRIVIGTHVNEPLVTISSAQSLSEYECAKPLDIKSAPIARLSALLQTAPSLIVAAQSSGKNLMEVVINGDLVRASDGNGFRAMTVGADGIKEHGRLFEVNNLENVINAAAIWQVASVLVAQKHLADISQKLEDLNKSINRVTEFLEGQRRARIKAIYGYLNQAVQAISNGELSPSVRGQLECCEQDLLEIQIHLKTEFEKKAKRRIEHKERFGTGELEKDISKK